MIPKGREFYLECAKLSHDRKYVLQCLWNFDRVLRKEWEERSKKKLNDR